MEFTSKKIKHFISSMTSGKHKNSPLIWIIICFLVSAPLHVFSQNQDKITIQLKNVTIEKAFRVIEKQSGFSFFYNAKDLNLKTKSDYSITNKKLEAALEIVLRNQPVEFFIKDKHIVLSKKKTSSPQEQTKVSIPKGKVSGKVLDSKGEAIAGATVMIKNTTTATSTDLNGSFSILTTLKNTLIVSYLGYLPMEIQVENLKTNLTIILEEDSKKLEEFVLVGYGKQKKITAIGSQSSLSIRDLKSQPVGNITNSIAGRIAGIISVQRSGEPGYDGSEIYIRGISTFTSSSPLVLVDGIERTFANVDPEDIESFSVLKDASATAVYGVRGANGVILIETKKGTAGKPKINFRANQGVTQFTKVPEFADGVTYLQMANEAYANSNPKATMPLYSEERIQKTADGSDPDLYPNINWIDQLFNKYGQNRRINTNINGGSDNATYYLSVGYYNESGMYKEDEMAQYHSSINFTRYNFTSNMNLQLLEHTKLDFGASGWIADGNYPGSSGSSIWNAAFVLPPIVIPARYSNGYIAQTRTEDVMNPYDLLTQTGYVSDFKSQLWSNIRLTQDLSPFIKGLSAYGMFSFDNYNEHRIARTKTVDTYLATGRDENGALIFDQMRIGSSYLGFSRSNGGFRQFYTEAALNYSNSFGKQDVSGMILYNQSDKTDAFASDVISSLPSRYQGIAARATYAYDTKYMAEINLGYNGSETFESGSRFGLFPSYGLGWIVSNEKFFEPLAQYVQLLKFRGSYGTVGNSSIGGRRYAYITTVTSTNGYSFGKTTDNSYNGLDVGDYAATVTWEKAKKLNIGAELLTWNNALSLTIDWFQENREGIFLQRGDLPDYAGVRDAPWGNLGEVYNHGFDGTFALNKKLSSDFSVEFRGNFTWNRATVIENANAPWPYPWQQRKGRKLGQRFGKVAIGLFQSEEEIANSPLQTGDIKPGDIKYKDLNPDGKIDSYDEGPIGYGSIPEIIYGFGPNISYKGFAVGAWIKGISNVDISLGGEGFQPFSHEGARGNLLSNITDRWTPNGTNLNPTYPRLTYPSTSNSNYDTSSWWIKNGAFLRLQNIEISYTFRRSDLLKPFGLNSLRLYLIGYNVATLSEFKMWDVELGDGKGASYPLTKTFNMGIDCQF